LGIRLGTASIPNNRLIGNLWVMPYSWSGTIIGEGTIVQLVIVYLLSVQNTNSHGKTGQGIIGHGRISYESFKT